jgi:hypothetical protein
MKRSKKERNRGNYWKETHKFVIFYMEIPVTKRKFLSQEGNSFHRKEIPFTGRKFLSQEENSFHRKEIHVTGKIFLS